MELFAAIYYRIPEMRMWYNVGLFLILLHLCVQMRTCHVVPFSHAEDAIDCICCCLSLPVFYVMTATQDDALVNSEMSWKTATHWQ